MHTKNSSNFIIKDKNIMHPKNLSNFFWFYKGDGLNAYIKNIESIEVGVFQYSQPLLDDMVFLELLLNVQNIKQFPANPVDIKHHQDVIDKKLYYGFCLGLHGVIRFRANCSYFRYTEKPDWLKLCCFWIEKNDVFLEKPLLLNN